jgi:hypothetical protein
MLKVRPMRTHEQDIQSHEPRPERQSAARMTRRSSVSIPYLDFTIKERKTTEKFGWCTGVTLVQDDEKKGKVLGMKYMGERSWGKCPSTLHYPGCSSEPGVEKAQPLLIRPTSLGLT